MNLARTRDIIKAHGVAAGMGDLVYRGVNRITEVTVLNAMALTMVTVDGSFLDGPDRGWGFVGLDEIIAQVRANGEALDLDEHFVRTASARGDRCYGVIDGGVLGSYGWYSELPTEVNRDLVLHYDSSYSYMYKGFTVPALRGKRLHGIGMARALAALTAEGKKGLVSYVASNNFASLRSCERLGYVEFGHVMAATLGGRILMHATRGCGAFGFHVEPKAPRSTAPEA